MILILKEFYCFDTETYFMKTFCESVVKYGLNANSYSFMS